MSRSLRPVAAPFVASAPAGARVRTRLRVSAQDEAVLRAVGRHLGSLAGRDLAARCAEGRLDAKGRAVSRARRKQALTAESSSRWAGAITRTSEDQVRLAGQNLRAEASGLRSRIRRIEARLPVPAGGKAGRVRGYAATRPGRSGSGRDLHRPSGAWRASCLPPTPGIREMSWPVTRVCRVTGLLMNDWVSVSRG